MDQPTWHRCTAANDGAPCVLDALHEQRDIPHLWADATDEIAERIHNLQVSYNAANAMAGVGKRHLERLWETRKRIRALCAELMTVDPANLTRAQRRQLPASVCRAVLAALDQPSES